MPFWLWPTLAISMTSKGSFVTLSLRHHGDILVFDEIAPLLLCIDDAVGYWDILAVPILSEKLDQMH
jgi:hypothetical protein